MLDQTRRSMSMSGASSASSWEKIVRLRKSARPTCAGPIEGDERLRQAHQPDSGGQGPLQVEIVDIARVDHGERAHCRLDPP